jgi:hypothetical protein
VQKATNGARGVFAVLQYTRKHGLVRERRVCVTNYISEFQNKLSWKFGISVSPPLE